MGEGKGHRQSVRRKKGGDSREPLDTAQKTTKQASLRWELQAWYSGRAKIKGRLKQFGATSILPKEGAQLKNRKASVKKKNGIDAI